MTDMQNQPLGQDIPGGINANQEFIIQRLYVKDSSFEAPNTPAVFRIEWKPEIALNIQTKNNALENDIHEVILTVTATVKVGETTAFLAEVAQAGIFTLRGFGEDVLKQILNTYCLSILFPYAREAISDLIVRGGFPPLYLAPMNFDALYQQYLYAQTQQPNQQAAATG